MWRRPACEDLPQTEPSADRHRSAAIRADVWKNALLERVPPGANATNKAEYREPKEMQRLRWEARLAELPAEGGVSMADLNQGQRHPGWKDQLADQLQREMGVPVILLAVALN